MWLVEITMEILPSSLLLQSADVLLITLIKLKLTLRNEGLPQLAECHKFEVRWPEKKRYCELYWAYGVVVSMFDFHRSDRGSNPGRGGKIS